MTRPLIRTLFVLGVSLVLSPSLFADGGEGHGRGSRLTPPDGTPFPEARGHVVLNPAHLLVSIEGVGAGGYSVLLDDGSGTKAAIGTITVAADDDEGDGEEGKGGDEGDEGDDDALGGVLKLGGDALPFGAASPLDLGGRAICITGADGAVVLAGTTPQKIPNDHEPRSGRCPLSPPEGAENQDASGDLKLESGGGRAVIKVHLHKLAAGGVHSVVITQGESSETIGMVTANGGGNGHFKLDSAKGDSLPFGVGDLGELVGAQVEVLDEAGNVVLAGVVCEPQTRPDGGEKPEKPSPRCFMASLSAAQEVQDPPVMSEGAGTAQINLTGRDGLTLRYVVMVEGLSGPPIAAHIHQAPAGQNGDVIVPLDHETLSGAVEITPEIAAALASGDTYVNVHTEAYPGGEIRGQVAACHDDDDEGDEGEDEGGTAAGAVVGVEEPLFLMADEFDTPFLRGDANADSVLDLSDAVSILSYLFSGGEKPYCLDAADTNDDGDLDLSDSVSLLTYLFAGGGAPSYPGTLIPGSDPTSDALYCQEQQ